MNAIPHSELLDKYITGTLSPEEKNELAKRLDDPAESEKIRALLEKDFLDNLYEAEDNLQLRTLIHEHLDRHLQPGQPIRSRMTPVRRILRIAAAAAILIILAGGAWFLLSKKSNEPLSQHSQQERFRNDIAPANQAAVLTLADGTTINLDQSANGALPAQGGTTVIKADGTISYREAVKTKDRILYNTIATAHGKQYQLVLSDGTKIWLNATSSLRFPTAFPGADRVVELTGEAYFEVAKNNAKPFYVRTGNTTVRVLGTHFNVNAYQNENTVRTTLLEGSVQVTDRESGIGNGESALSDSRTVILKPGQQSQIINHQLSIINQVDLANVMAWKNGMFWFNNQDIGTIMREIARWYNVEIHYEGNITARFTSMMPRNIPVSRLLHAMELTEEVKFIIEGKKITVLPASS